MRERRAVSSFFFDRFTLIKRLPPDGWIGDEPVLTRVSFSRECSLVFLCDVEPPPGAELNMLWSEGAVICNYWAFLMEALTAASVLLS